MTGRARTGNPSDDPLDAGADPVGRVTTLELFFDLVFVFTITQLTSLLVEELTWQTLAHVVVMLGLIFWMYDGYAWLTNAVPARGTARRVLLLGGMAGYLVIAIAVPSAFDGNGLIFGLALLAITLVHAFLFVHSASERSSAAMLSLAPTNLAAVSAVVLGGAIGGDVQAYLWAGAVLYEWFLTRPGSFEIGPAHFVERHGLLVIVAIGESVVAIGIGAAGLPIDARLVGLAVLGLLLCIGLWWTYFGSDDDEAAERAMTNASDPDRVRMAFQGFGYAHYLILLGIVLAAVGIEEAVAHPGEPLQAGTAFALCGGVAIFLAGDAWFRSILGLGRTVWRSGAALLVLLGVPVATDVTAAAGLAVATALLLAALALEPGAREAR